MPGIADENGGGGGRLEQAKLFLREDFASIDPVLPSLLSVLQKRGAGECWHKHGTFYEHLLHVYRILKLWGLPDSVALCGLFHSSYSNSYVNLAIFEPNVERQKVRDLIGDAAEELVHLFCIVPRQQLIFDLLLLKFSDEELVSALRGVAERGDIELEKANEIGGKETHDLLQKMERLGSNFEAIEEKGRSGVNGKDASYSPLIPSEGLVVKHIATGEDVLVPRRLIAIFLVLTMADFIDQSYGWQDILFGNEDGTYRFRGNGWTALWPGECKPGLWMSGISRMGLLLNILLKEEQAEEKEQLKSEKGKNRRPFSEIDIPIPSVFNNCTQMLSPSDQVTARDLYWEAICITDQEKIWESAEPLLKKACEHNPFIAEPHLVLAQIYLSKSNFELAEKEASEGLRLLLEWATNWDKRMTWEGWVAWARVLLQNAGDKTWARDNWGMINLGLVK